MSVSKAIDDMSSFDAKQVLIFGGSRFMGHSLTKTLLEKGHFVTIVNRGNLYWDDKHDSFSKKYQNQFNQIKINRNDKTKLKTSLENAANRLKPKSFDFIVDYSAYDPDDVSPVVDFAQKIQNAHYIFISSDSVYEVSDVEQHKSLDIRVETNAQRPKDPELIKQLRERDDYGDDKMRCEELLRETPQTMAFTALRLPDVFGPRDNTDRHWSYQLLVKLALNGRPLQIEEKEQRRLLSGVDAFDVTRAILTIMEHPKKCHRESFNIAWREHFTLQTYLNTIAEVLIELSPRVKQKSIHFEVLEPEEENMFHYLPSVTERTGPVSIEKFTKLTNWQPTPFKTSMRTIVEWFEQAWHKFPAKRPHDDDLSETEWNALKQLYSDINKDEL